MRLETSLFCVVTGLEHSGTTVFANALKSVPGLMGGFECGLALKPLPALFLGYLTRGGEHWGLTQEQRDEILSLDFAKAYAYLQANSPIMRGERLVDKTPAYCLELSAVMQKLDVPFIVVEKPYEMWVKSNIKRQRGTHCEYRWQQYKRSLSEANGYYLLNFDTIEKDIAGAFDWLGLDYKEEYLTGQGYRNKLFARTGCYPGRELFKESLK